MISNGQEIPFVDGGIYTIVDGRNGDLVNFKFLKLSLDKDGDVLGFISNDRLNWDFYRDLCRTPKELRFGAILEIDFVTPTEDQISELV